MRAASPPLPTFLILGAARSGTTTLYHAFRRHPEIYFSDPKEPVYFELEYRRGPDYYRETYFGGWSGEPAVGEGRVFHLFLPYVPARIRKCLPDARLIAILRNPVDRAYSHWWRRYAHGDEARSFPVAVEQELARLESGTTFFRDSGGDAPGAETDARERRWRDNIRPGSLETGRSPRLEEVPYVEMGHYSDQLERYLNLFPESQIHIALFETLRRDPESLIRRLWRFLGVEAERTAVEPEARNVAPAEVKGGLASRLESFGQSAGVLRYVPAPVRTAVRSSLSRHGIRRPPMEEEIRRRLAAHYRPRYARLERLLDRELDVWKV